MLRCLSIGCDCVQDWSSHTASEPSGELAATSRDDDDDDDDDDDSMVVECPHCMKQLKIEADGYDTFLCPGCRREFRVPG